MLLPAIRRLIFQIVLIPIAWSGSVLAEPRASPLELSYQEFDQTPHNGWRALADRKQFRDAAKLIDDYLHRRPGLDRFQRANLNWHAAQLLAFAGETSAAIERLPSTRLTPEPDGSTVRWNDYVDATDAFLRRNREALIAAKNRIVQSNPGDPNLRIVESLIAHFGSTYAKAYGIE